MIPMNSSLIEEMEKIGRANGVDLMTYGCIGGRNLFYRPENERYLRESGMVYSISLAAHYADSVVDLLELHEDEGMLFYFQQHNRSLSDHLEYAAHRIAVFLSDNGQRAMVIPGRGKGYREGVPGIISHKALANISGMGTMSDSGMIVTREYGPRVRLCSMLTDLELPVPSMPVADYCLHCGRCRDACPAGAIGSGRFDPRLPDEPYTEHDRCAEYRSERAKRLGTRFCNLCMAACPVGRLSFKAV